MLPSGDIALSGIITTISIIEQLMVKSLLDTLCSYWSGITTTSLGVFTFFSY